METWKVAGANPHLPLLLHMSFSSCSQADISVFAVALVFVAVPDVIVNNRLLLQGHPVLLFALALSCASSSHFDVMGKAGEFGQERVWRWRSGDGGHGTTIAEDCESEEGARRAWTGRGRSCSLKASSDNNGEHPAKRIKVQDGADFDNAVADVVALEVIIMLN